MFTPNVTEGEHDQYTQDFSNDLIKTHEQFEKIQKTRNKLDEVLREVFLERSQATKHTATLEKSPDGQ